MIGILPLIHRMLAHRRFPAAAVCAPLEALLSRSEGQEALKAGPGRPPARRAPGLLERPPVAAGAARWLARRGLRSRDHRVRRQAAERLAGAAAPLERWFGQLIQDPDLGSSPLGPRPLRQPAARAARSPSPRADLRPQPGDPPASPENAGPELRLRPAAALPVGPRRPGGAGGASRRAPRSGRNRRGRRSRRARGLFARSQVPSPSSGGRRPRPPGSPRRIRNLLSPPGRPGAQSRARGAAPLLSRTWPSPRLIAAQKEAQSSISRRAVAASARRVFNWDRVELLLLLATEKDPVVQRIVQLIVEGDVFTARNFGKLEPNQGERLRELLAAASLPADLGGQLSFLIKKAP